MMPTLIPFTWHKTIAEKHFSPGRYVNFEEIMSALSSMHAHVKECFEEKQHIVVDGARPVCSADTELHGYYSGPFVVNTVDIPLPEQLELGVLLVFRGRIPGSVAGEMVLCVETKTGVNLVRE